MNFLMDSTITIIPTCTLFFTVLQSRQDVLGARRSADLSEFVAIMADLVLGAALGTAFTVLYDAVHEATVGNFNKIKPLLGALESTLASIQPLVIKQLGDYNLKLELPNDEVEKLQKQMREGKELICRLSKLPWWNRIKSRYIVQLVGLDASLKGLLKHIMMQQARDIKENLLVAKQTAKQLVEFQEFNEKLLRERTLLQEDARDSQRKFVLQLQNNGKQLLQLERVIEELMLQQEAKGVIDAETGGAGDLVGVAGLVTLSMLLSESVQQLLKDNVTYKPVLRNIKSTLDTLDPAIELIKENDKYLTYGQKRQIECLKKEMRDGVELIRRYSKFGAWNIYRNLSCANNLIQWEESLQREIDLLIIKLEGKDQYCFNARSAGDISLRRKPFNDQPRIIKFRVVKKR